jgi:hypothetical protein
MLKQSVFTCGSPDRVNNSIAAWPPSEQISFVTEWFLLCQNASYWSNPPTHRQAICALHKPMCKLHYMSAESKICGTQFCAKSEMEKRTTQSEMVVCYVNVFFCSDQNLWQ